ncbi:KAP family P-loop NTPase fold protein [Delftia acidovorans]|uniref:KAP family P-loop NTPase fold protein n=1 Tax=Delftia acidovorans TaxID=80866 RepID=UPI00286F96EF|nr:P-loop NTPase fold protein [Delftia acidovorans]
MKYKANLSSDVPVSDPAQDAYGFTGFAKNVSKAIRVTPSPQGLVMAINGPWGSGKSSLLNLIKFELKTEHENDRPIVIDFNPWWFNGRDHLAIQFLSLFGRQLRNESVGLLKIGELIAEYSGALSKAVAFSTGIPWIDVPVNALLKLLKRKPREVPQLKEEISKLLRSSSRRILFMVDDLDRLTPDEIREVFKVVKALADFPNVIYLLSFDKIAVAEALSKSLGVDGDLYLEKIVQAAFALPAVGKNRLQRKLFSDLDLIVEAVPSAEFNATYWGNVYFDGLNHFIVKPRDIVRVINALMVTYPPVAGEVNPVDYIALEFLRVFQPAAYSTIRDNKDMFVGTLTREGRHDDVKAFHQSWIASINERDRAPVTALVERMFPKVESAIGRIGYESGFLPVWRKALRACSPEHFDIYFQFGVSDDHLKQADLMKILDVSGDVPVLVEMLKAATKVTRVDGHSKAKDYVDRLTELAREDITVRQSEHFLEAIFAIDVDLLTSADERGGMMSIPNHWRMLWLIRNLLERIPEADRAALLQRCIREGQSYPAMANVVGQLVESRADPSKKQGWMAGIPDDVIGAMKVSFVERIDAADLNTLFSSEDTRLILFNWSRWNEPKAVRAKLLPVLDDASLLERLLPRFLTTGSSYVWGDRVSKTIYQLDPRDLERYFDLDTLLVRVQALEPKLKADSLARIASQHFILGMERVKEGLPSGREMLDGN